MIYKRFIKLLGLFSLLFLFLAASGCSGNKKEKEKQDLYAIIDREIEKVPLYDAEKEKRINNIRLRLQKEKSPDLRKELTDWLISEYESYISDSALYYINLNLENPIVKNNIHDKTATLIKKADVAAHAGLFGESADILDSLDKSIMDSTLLESYYSAYCDLYQYHSEYAVNSEYAARHERLRELYIDSVCRVAPESSIAFIINYAGAKIRNGNYNEAETILLENLHKYSDGDRNYSIISSILADLYKQKGDEGGYHKYIGESVISDIKGAVKENMAIRALATECFKEGDLERADRYLRQSFADANFFAARMRNAQSSRMLPIIGDAYSAQQKKSNHQLSLLVIFISILAFGFIIISIFAFYQVRNVRKINKKTNAMLEKVSALSNRLTQLNSELSTANEELKTSSAIQGEYGVLFMEYSSLAISALQKYQQSLKVVAAQGNLDALKKKINSANFENKTLAEFYSKFDEAVLNIYPHFVDNFNSLLKPEDRIELKPKEALTTELRVFALIRVGISDSEKIAKFLRCSISTVYTYKSKIKKKAINPDTFENDVTKI